LLYLKCDRLYDISQCAYTPKNGEDYYFFGWHISADGEKLMHTGGVENFGSCVIIDLKSRTAVATLCNSMLSPTIWIKSYLNDIEG
jgi:hypothetical protein